MEAELIDQKLENSIQKALNQGSFAVIPANLQRAILFRINVERQLKTLKTKLFGAFGVLAITLVLFVFALDVSFKAFAQTPTFKFISLLFTDFSQIAAYWQDFSYSVLESLPLGAIAFLLISFLASLILGQYVLSQMSGFKKLLNSTTHAK